VDREPNGGRAGPRNVRGLGFIENPWGEKAREFVKTTKRLDESRWRIIIEHAHAYLSAELDRDAIDEDNNEIGGEDGCVNPRAAIDLDW
jgi:hypothetical protein